MINCLKANSLPSEIRRRHQFFRISLGLGLALLVLPAFLPGLGSAKPRETNNAIREKKKQVKQLQLEREQVRRHLSDFRVSEKELTQQLKTFTRSIREIKRRERKLNREWKKQNALKIKQEAQLTSLNEKTEESRGRVSQHLRRLYRLSKLGASATLFTLADYKSSLKNGHYLALVIRFDQETIKQYQALNFQVASKREQVATTLSRLVSLQSTLQDERKTLGKNQVSFRALLGKMRNNQLLYRQYLDELATVMKGMENAIVKLERRHSENRLRTSLPNLTLLRGSLPSPVRGKVVAAFGRLDPRYDLKKYQRGIIIRVDDAVPVRAVASGRVVHAGPFRGYQNLVVLDHGNGVFTVYGYLENLQVKKGGWVRGKSPLGSAAYQPVDTAYNVYFEIRSKGKPQDPIKWIKPGSLGKTG